MRYDRFCTQNTYKIEQRKWPDFFVPKDAQCCKTYNEKNNFPIISF